MCQPLPVTRGRGKNGNGIAKTAFMDPLPEAASLLQGPSHFSQSLSLAEQTKLLLWLYCITAACPPLHRFLSKSQGSYIKRQNLPEHPRH